MADGRFSRNRTPSVETGSSTVTPVVVIKVVVTGEGNIVRLPNGVVIRLVGLTVDEGFDT